jgi:hypothetical protein
MNLFWSLYVVYVMMVVVMFGGGERTRYVYIRKGGVYVLFYLEKDKGDCSEKADRLMCYIQGRCIVHSQCSV